MADDIYVNLGKRLNKNLMRLPLGDPVIAFLKKAFTPAQAEIGAGFPIGSHTLPHLARVFQKEEDKLLSMLDTMADKGLMFIYENDANEKEYSLPPFFPGIVEFQSMRGTETQEDIEMAHTVKAMMNYLNDLGKDLFKDPEAANKILPAALRTLTIEKKLPQGTTIMPFEQVSALMAKERSFAAVYCHCRHQEKLVDNPCKIQNVPERTCFYFGKVADFMVDRGFARRVSREECLDILQQCEAAGLVHNINNYIGRSLVLCNCCSCCCDFLVRMKTYRGLKNVARSNFIARLEEENCTGCGTCLSRCQMEAITLEEETITLIEDYCIGCGNCTTTCPSGALTMVRHAHTRPMALTFDFPGLGV